MIPRVSHVLQQCRLRCDVTLSCFLFDVALSCFLFVIRHLLDDAVCKVQQQTPNTHVTDGHVEHHCEAMVNLWRLIQDNYSQYYQIVTDNVIKLHSWSQIAWYFCTNTRNSKYTQLLNRYFINYDQKRVSWFYQLPPRCHDRVMQFLTLDEICVLKQTSLFAAEIWEKSFASDVSHQVWADLVLTDAVDKMFFLRVILGDRRLLHALIFDKRILPMDKLQHLQKCIQSSTTRVSNTVGTSQLLALYEGVLRQMVTYINLTDYCHLSQSNYYLWIKLSNIDWFKHLWLKFSVTDSKYNKIMPSISSNYYIQFINNVSHWFHYYVPQIKHLPLWNAKHLTTYCGNILYLAQSKHQLTHLQSVLLHNQYCDFTYHNLNLGKINRFFLFENVMLPNQLIIDCCVFVCGKGQIGAQTLNKFLNNPRCTTIVLWFTRIDMNITNTRVSYESTVCNKHLIWIHDKWTNLNQFTRYCFITSRIRKITLVIKWDSWNTEAERAVLSLLDVIKFPNLFHIELFGLMSAELHEEVSVTKILQFGLWLKKNIDKIQHHQHIGSFQCIVLVADDLGHSFDVKKCFTNDQLNQHCKVMSKLVLTTKLSNSCNNDGAMQAWSVLVSNFL